MIKFLLNLLLSLILGKLKPVLLKHIETIDGTMISNVDKRNTVLTNFKDDLVVAGKEIGTNFINLALEAGVALVKDKIK